MPISPRTSEPLREAVGRLRAACSDAWALDYIDHHAGRSIDDVLRLASLRPGARVLNVGGAPYIFEAAAEAAGLRVTTLDIDPARHTAIIEAVGADVIEADFEHPDGRGAVAASWRSWSSSPAFASSMSAIAIVRNRADEPDTWRAPSTAWPKNSSSI